MDRLKIGLLLAAFVIGAGYLAKVYVTATSPSSVKVTLYKAELMTDRSDANPVVVFSDPAGRKIDLTRDKGDFIAPAGAADGVYQRIRLTVKNEYTMSTANAKDNPCGGEIFTDQVFSLDKGADPNAQVPVYFASPEDGGSAWKDSQITNYLIKPVTLTQKGPRDLKIGFITDDTLFCLSGDVARRAPWSAWSEMMQ